MSRIEMGMTVDLFGSVKVTGTHDFTGVPTLGMRNKYLQVGGTFNATFQVQGTIDDVHWMNEGAAISAASTAAVAVNPTYKRMRIQCTIFASADVADPPTAVVSGFRANQMMKS